MDVKCWSSNWFLCDFPHVWSIYSVKPLHSLTFSRKWGKNAKALAFYESFGDDIIFAASGILVFSPHSRPPLLIKLSGVNCGTNVKFFPKWKSLICIIHPVVKTASEASIDVQEHFGGLYFGFAGEPFCRFFGTAWAGVRSPLSTAAAALVIKDGVGCGWPREPQWRRSKSKVFSQAFKKLLKALPSQMFLKILWKLEFEKI